MGATISFAVSSLLIVAMLGFRRFELYKGRTYFQHARDKADDVVLRVVVFIRRGVIRAGKQALRNFAVNLMHRMTLSALSVVRMTEDRLVAFIAYMKTRYSSRKKGSTSTAPSPFLKTIVEERREEKSTSK